MRFQDVTEELTETDEARTIQGSRTYPGELVVNSG